MKIVGMEDMDMIWIDGTVSLIDDVDCCRQLS